MPYFNVSYIHATEKGREDLPKPGGFVSPMAEGFMKHPSDQRVSSQPDRGVRTWGMNIKFQDKGPWRIERMKKPLSMTILVTAGSGNEKDIFFIAAGSGAGIDSGWQLDGEVIKPWMDFYKNGKADYLMADGHVMVMTPAEAKNNRVGCWIVN